MGNQILQGNSLSILKELPSRYFNTCVTSPPYWGLRDYGVDGQLGLEATPEEYVQNLVEVFREVKRTLRDDGTLWLNLGDSYASVHTGGHKSEKSTVGANHEGAQEFKQNKAQPHTYGLKHKDLVGIPWMVAFALRADGWYLRSDIIWHKPNPMPESVTDRPTKAHEYIFLLSKSKNYYYDYEVIKEEQQQESLDRLKRGWNGDGERDYPSGVQNHLNKYFGKTDEEIEKIGGRNKRTVWTITTKPYKEAHFATFPLDLIEPCILAGCPEGGRVLDPFFGSGTTGEASIKHNRNFTGIELNAEYIELAKRRLKYVQPVFL